MAKGKTAGRVVDLRRGDAEVEQHAVDRAEAKLGEDFRQFGKPCPPEDEAGLGGGEVQRRTLGGRIAIERDDATGIADAGQHGARVAAAAEGGVDVDAARLDRQRRHGFIEQDGDMAAIGHQSVKPSSSGGRPPSGKAIAWEVSACHCASSHNSNLRPCPTSTARRSRFA